MNVYAIHRKTAFNIHRNIKLCSSQKIAEKEVEKLKLEYDKWHKCLQEEFDHKYPMCGYNATYNPDKYMIERIQVIRS